MISLSQISKGSVAFWAGAVINLVPGSNPFVHYHVASCTLLGYC